jgi:hypothetical protein
MSTQNPQITDAVYLNRVISLYVKLPDTPVSPSRNDIITAASFISQGIPLHTVESAILLASVRRLARPDDAIPLPPVRSLAYFAPVVRELSDNPLPDGYHKYLLDKLHRLVHR